MNKLTFEEIRKRGLLLFEYVRGSKLYHTDTLDSDTDTGGVFICPPDYGFEIVEEVADEKNDTKWWELGKFMKMAMSSNPAVIEAFFVPDDLVLYEHPLFEKIRQHRDEFITKAAFKPFGTYAVSQIQKAQGQNKKIHWDMENMQRKTPLDFCYTFDGRQGSVCIKEWLDDNGLRQDCCGLVNLKNMKNCYLMYYDFGQHFRIENTDFYSEKKNNSNFFRFMMKHFEKQIIERRQKADSLLSVLYKEKNEEVEVFEINEDIQKEIHKISNQYPEKYIDIMETQSIYDYILNKIEKPIGGHCGIINNDGTSNTVRLCSTDKDESPICMMTYNEDGYSTHCKKYKEYEEWKNKRNKARYESNMKAEKSGDPDMKYDCKNMYHSFRNVAMCTEIAQGKGLILDRTGIDRDFLMDVRNRKFGYSELMAKLKVMTEEMQKSCEESTIPEKIDEDMVLNLVKNTRLTFFKEYMNKQTTPVEDKSTEKRENNVSKILKIFEKLIDSIGIKKEDIMLTGSIALMKHGILPENKIPKDIDAVVKCGSEMEHILRAVTLLNGGHTYWKVKECHWKGIEHKPYVFTYEGVEINIWVQSPDTEFDSEITCKEGFHIATVKHILEAKKYYGRRKDVTDIIDMGINLLSGLGRKNSGNEENY